MFKSIIICCMCATGSFLNAVENTVNDTSSQSYIFEQSSRGLHTENFKNFDERSEDIQGTFDIDEEKNNNEKDINAELGFDITTETSHEYHYITIIAEVTGDIKNTENTNVKSEAEYVGDKKESEITNVENRAENTENNKNEEASSGENDEENTGIRNSAVETGDKNADDKNNTQDVEVKNETKSRSVKRAEDIDFKNEAGSANDKNKAKDVEVKSETKTGGGINRAEVEGIKNEAESADDKNKTESTDEENETNIRDGKNKAKDVGFENEAGTAENENKPEDLEVKNETKTRGGKNRAESRSIENEDESADNKYKTENSYVKNEIYSIGLKNRSEGTEVKNEAESLDDKNITENADFRNRAEEVYFKNETKSRSVKRTEDIDVKNGAKSADDKNKSKDVEVKNETKSRSVKKTEDIGVKNEAESADDKNKAKDVEVKNKTKSQGVKRAEGIDFKNEAGNAGNKNKAEDVIIKNETDSTNDKNKTEDVDVETGTEDSGEKIEAENTSKRNEAKSTGVGNEAENAFETDNTEDENSSNVYKEIEKYLESFDDSKNDSFRNKILNPRKFCFPLFRSSSNVKLDERVANSPYYRRIQFKLWTIENPEVPAIKIFGTNKLHFPEFNPLRKTVVLIHGIHNKSIDYLDEFFENFRKAMLYSEEGNNILAVDYSSAVLDDTLNSARGKAVFIAQHIARGLKDLRFVNCDNLNDVCKPSYTFLIGHELGAFIAGVVASEFQQSKIERLMGLSPTFFKNPLGNNWSKNSAELVEVIYSANCEKPPENVSHRAFYINSGYYPQKSCDSDPYGFCSINMAFNAYYFSMTERSFQFSATLCPSFEEYVGGRCDTFPTLPLYNNIKANDAVMGNYYLTWSNKFRLEKGKVTKSSPNLNYHIKRLSKTF